LNLRELLQLNDTPVVKTARAEFYCHVPSIAPYAYLHTIYSPASWDILSSFGPGFQIPDEWLSFLLIQNGADLFSNALCLYGVNNPRQLLDRSSNYSQAAFSLQELNHDAVLVRFRDYLQIGSYGYNAARLLLSRTDLSIQVVSRSGADTLAGWPDPQAYFTEECGRLRSLFSDSGVLLTDERWTVPVDGYVS
jgi:hypothetical protein